MIGYLNVPYNSKVLQCLSGNCPSGSGIFKITLVQSCLSVPERFFFYFLIKLPYTRIFKSIHDLLVKITQSVTQNELEARRTCSANTSRNVATAYPRAAHLSFSLHS